MFRRDTINIPARPLKINSQGKVPLPSALVASIPEPTNALSQCILVEFGYDGAEPEKDGNVPQFQRQLHKSPQDNLVQYEFVWNPVKGKSNKHALEVVDTRLGEKSAQMADKRWEGPPLKQYLVSGEKWCKSFERGEDQHLYDRTQIGDYCLVITIDKDDPKAESSRGTGGDQGSSSRSAPAGAQGRSTADSDVAESLLHCQIGGRPT